MATERTTGLTYDDLLEMFPEEDKVRRELIGGELLVSPPPTIRHEAVFREILGRLWLYGREHGGEAYGSRAGVFFTDRDRVEPDVLFVRAEHLDRVELPSIRGGPDLVVEISSPTTRVRDLVGKKDLYELHGVPEYWFVDLDSDEIRIYRLEEGRYASPVLLGRDDMLESLVLPGFSASVGEIFGPPTA